MRRQAGPSRPPRLLGIPFFSLSIAFADGERMGDVFLARRATRAGVTQLRVQRSIRSRVPSGSYTIVCNADERMFTYT